MAVYDFVTLKTYHGKRIRIIENAVSLREGFLGIWRPQYIQKEYLTNFEKLKEPHYEFYHHKFYLGKTHNFNRIYNSVSVVVTGGFAKPQYQPLFDDYWQNRLSPLKAEREMHIERLQTLSKFSGGGLFEIPETGPNNRKAINYIERFISMRKR